MNTHNAGSTEIDNKLLTRLGLQDRHLRWILMINEQRKTDFLKEYCLDADTFCQLIAETTNPYMGFMNTDGSYRRLAIGGSTIYPRQESELRKYGFRGERVNWGDKSVESNRMAGFMSGKLLGKGYDKYSVRGIQDTILDRVVSQLDQEKIWTIPGPDIVAIITGIKELTKCVTYTDATSQ